MAIRFTIPGNFTNPDLPVLDLVGFVDTFARADATTLGSTEVPPRPWAVEPSATIQGITSEAAYVARSGTLGPTIGYAESRTANGTVTATLGGWAENYNGLAFRIQSLTDYWRFTQNRSVFRLEKVVGNTTTVVNTSSGITPKAGDVISVVLNGTSIICQVNGSTVFTTTSADHQTATRHGIYSSGGSANTIRDITVAV